MTELDELVPERAPPTTQHGPRNLLLLFSVLLLFILAQVIFLGWGAEAVFITTWLFLALVIRHDSRLSPAIGLIFLATCPFLLIANRDSVAERAANYAFFFLAIGVAVQLEEPLLERFGWLDRKLDLSYLWRPAARALGGRWAATRAAIECQLVATRGVNLLRWIKIAGTVALVTVSLSAALSGVRPPLPLMLFLSGLLFPLVVSALRRAAKAFGTDWLWRSAPVLLTLCVGVIGVIGLTDPEDSDPLAHMVTQYDFVRNRQLAERTFPVPEGEVLDAGLWDMDEEWSEVLLLFPADSGSSRVAYDVDIEDSYILAFAVGMAPGSWKEAGDGVAFAVYLQSHSGTGQLFSTYIDPKGNLRDRSWYPAIIDLSEYAGQVVTIIFETSTGPAGDYRFDWAGWRAPRLLRPEAED